MTKNDIIRMALEAGWPYWEIICMKNELNKFAQLAAAAEREACAEVFEGMTDEQWIYLTQAEGVEVIRARGEA